MHVVELRQYTLREGMRETLIDLFDRHFIEGQEACGMTVLGQFRDLDRPDRFVWLRGFADMAARRDALERFYGGPVWAEHKDAANATMIDWHDVLLLKPAWEGSGVKVDRAVRAPVEASRGAEVTIAIWPVQAERMPEFAGGFRSAFPDAMGAFVTESAETTYPALPVRAGEGVFVVAFDGTSIIDDLGTVGMAPAQTLRLAPTARSRLRGA